MVKRLSMIIVMMTVLFISACGRDDVTLTNVTFDATQLNASYDLDAFDIESFYLTLEMSDGTNDTVKIDSSMLNASDLERLEEAGTHTVDVFYEGYKVAVTVTLNETLSPLNALIRSIYDLGVLEGAILEDMTYEAWLASIRGEDGLPGRDGMDGEDGIDGREITFEVADGYIKWQYQGDATWRNLIALSSLEGSDGTNGLDGVDGLTPFIGNNGNWYIGDTDLGVFAGFSIGNIEVNTEGFMFTEVFTGDALAYVVTGYQGSDKDVIVPSTYKGLDVIGIGFYAFGGKAMDSITIPASIESIGLAAFINTPLQSITIEGDASRFHDVWNDVGLEHILKPNLINYQGMIFDPYEGEILEYQGSSKDITIPSQIEGHDVLRIGEIAFYNNGLETLTIEEGITTISENAFNQNQLSEVRLANSITTIGEGAFGNNILTSITLPENLVSIEANVFINNKLTEIDIPTSVQSIGEYAFWFNQLERLVIPGSVKTIDDHAFGYNPLNMLFILEGVESIAESVFIDNVLTRVTLPESLTSIGSRAFEQGFNASGFVSIIILGDQNRFNDTWQTIGFNALLNPRYELLTNDVLFDPETQTIISYTGTSKDIVIPSQIGGVDVLHIADNVFAYVGLTAMSLPNTLKTIGKEAFLNNSIQTLTIPASVESIGDDAFTFSGVINLTIAGDYARFNVRWDEIGFAENLRPGIVEYDSMFLDTYLEMIYLSDNTSTVIDIPSKIDGYHVRHIGDEVFANQGKETIANLPSSLLTIGDGAFRDNQFINITLPFALTHIGDGAFANNVLETVTLNDRLEHIGVEAFANNQLTSITIPDTVTYIGGYAFVDNPLESVTILGVVTRFNTMWMYLGFHEVTKPTEE